MATAGFAGISLSPAEEGAAALATAATMIGFELTVEQFGVNDPPSSPATGAWYGVGDTPSGAWTGYSPGDLAQAQADGSWVRKRNRVGWKAKDVTSGTWRRNVGYGEWVETQELGERVDGLTASVTQAQGQVPLGHYYNRFSTCAHAADACTLPPALAGREVWVINDGAAALAVYPTSGVAIDALSADAAFSLAAGKRARFYAFSATSWASFKSA